MKKLLRGLVVLGALAGIVYAARSFLRGESAGQESVQLVFDDGSTHSISSNTIEGEEFTDIAREVFEIGV